VDSRWTVVGVVLLAACGRWGFSSQSSGDASDDASDAADDVASEGTAIDAALPIAPPAGNGLRLDGTGYLRINSNCAQIPVELTIAAWVYTDASQGLAYTEVFALNSNSGGENLSLVQWDPSGPKINYYDDTVTNAVYSGLLSSANQWHYVALVIDANHNGALYDSTKLVLTFRAPRTVLGNALLSVGQEWDGGNPSELFTGKIDELAIWRTVRTTAQLAADTGTRPSMTDPSLVSFYTFELGDARDDSGHGHDGTLVGGATFVAN